MGIRAVSDDFISAMVDILDEIGHTLTLKYFTETAISPSDPGAGKTKTEVLAYPEGLLLEYKESYFEGTEVKKGDRLAIISIVALTFTIEQGMFVINNGREYAIIDINEPEISGNGVVVLAQIRD